MKKVKKITSHRCSQLRIQKLFYLMKDENFVSGTKIESGVMLMKILHSRLT